MLYRWRLQLLLGELSWFGLRDQRPVRLEIGDHDSQGIARHQDG